jgi:hypothetical protein
LRRLKKAELRVEHLRQSISVNIARRFTHPVIASLDRPPFAARKEGRKIPLLYHNPAINHQLYFYFTQLLSGIY